MGAGFNVPDVCSVQECLEAYKKLIEWLPATDEVEEELKADRIRIINYLVRKAELVIRNKSEEDKIWEQEQ